MTTGSSSTPAFYVAIENSTSGTPFRDSGVPFPDLTAVGARETPSDTKQCAHPNAHVARGKACSVRRVPSTLADEHLVQSLASDLSASLASNTTYIWENPSLIYPSALSSTFRAPVSEYLRIKHVSCQGGA